MPASGFLHATENRLQPKPCSAGGRAGALTVAVPVALPVAELGGAPGRATVEADVHPPDRRQPLQARPVNVTVRPAGSVAGDGSSQAERTGLTESGGWPAG